MCQVLKRQHVNVGFHAVSSQPTFYLTCEHRPYRNKTQNHSNVGWDVSQHQYPANDNILFVLYVVKRRYIL